MKMNSPEFKTLSPAKKAAHMRKLEYQREYTRKKALQKKNKSSDSTVTLAFPKAGSTLDELCTEYYITNRRLAQITEQLKSFVTQLKL